MRIMSSRTTEKEKVLLSAIYAAFSSRELIADRVLYLKYPPGYTPKRTTHAMRALPQLANQIDNLTAFLQDAASKKN